MLSRHSIGHATGLFLAALYTFAGQAHFNSYLTPEFANHIELMTRNSARAFWFLHLTYSQLKSVFGAFDLVAAALLWRSATRRAGLWMSIIGFGGGLYGQWYTGTDLGQVGLFFAIAVLGTVLI